ncbi:TorF family putative porin [uncultured Ferrimonas sp.]|uniref:TorF family putative porin n=1 Tax=uncultured Ferrimonas sp. TaxID=432640 RepID=UPI00260BBED4|nr:TorF family putative porin [uncultured Ferrimonas sp.]
MNMFIRSTFAATVLISSANAAALELGSGTNVTFNAAVVSNYLFRGVTLSDDKIAGQLGADLEHDSGFYAGVWGSNYDNDGDNEIEIDWWGGYGFAINDNIDIDLGVTRYYYADVGGHSTEFYAGAAVYGLGLTLYYDDTLESYYFEGNYDFDVADNTVLSTHAGYTEPDGADGAYDMGVTVTYDWNEYVALFVGVVTHEEEDEAFVAGVNFSF